MYGLFRRRQRDGIWKRLLQQLQVDADANGLITWDVSVDSTIVRAQHAAGARTRGTSKGTDPAELRSKPQITDSVAPGVA